MTLYIISDEFEVNRSVLGTDQWSWELDGSKEIKLELYSEHTEPSFSTCLLTSFMVILLDPQGKTQVTCRSTLFGTEDSL